MYTKSRKDLVMEHLPLVRKVASKIFRRLPEGVVDFDELVNTGVIGLIKAIEKYDSNRAKFSTYAYIKIRGEILDYLRKLDFLPRNVREKIKNGEASEVREEIATLISIEEKLFGNSERYCIKDTLASDLPDPEDQVLREEAKRVLSSAISQLSEKEQLVLQLIFVEELDLKSIGEILGVSVSRVSQIKTGALKKLKKTLEHQL